MSHFVNRYWIKQAFFFEVCNSVVSFYFWNIVCIMSTQVWWEEQFLFFVFFSFFCSFLRRREKKRPLKPRQKTSIVTISIRPFVEENKKKYCRSNYKTWQCGGSISILDNHLFFFCFCFIHSILPSGSFVKWWKSRYAAVHTSTLEPSLHYVKTLNQREKQEIPANILEGHRSTFECNYFKS